MEILSDKLLAVVTEIMRKRLSTVIEAPEKLMGAIDQKAVACFFDIETASYGYLLFDSNLPRGKPQWFPVPKFYGMTLGTHVEAPSAGRLVTVPLYSTVHKCIKDKSWLIYPDSDEAEARFLLWWIEETMQNNMNAIVINQLAEQLYQVSKRMTINIKDQYPALYKKAIREFGFDPIYRAVLEAEGADDLKKAMNTLRNIRGDGALKQLQRFINKHKEASARNAMDDSQIREWSDQEFEEEKLDVGFDKMRIAKRLVNMAKKIME